ncbi:voltage-dependent calcium channel subunit alpha-2/delta-3 [Culicoides brevitarsis]|uniref:voltage-dependent calcium channel subunit alpha-2/delta-3 n=1 Tax=Culicoides brevitarsis TaxID=469753 RepID=UPI00307B551B
MKSCKMITGTIILALLLTSDIINGDPDEDIPHNEVRNWALKFGVDLWEFGKQLTKMENIKNKYKDRDVEVTRKDGIMLLREIATEVKNFMDFKMNAVMRIMDSAEQAALSESDPDAQSQKSSNGYYDSRTINEYKSDGSLSDGSRQLILTHLRRFEGLPVNVTYSSLLVPEGIELSDAEVQQAVSWSSHLDPLFANNLERDPALSWQYFGSSTGFLRRFPGTAWPAEGHIDNKPITDFRSEDWFIQAAASPKDVIILLDTSSSMSGKEYALAMETASAILDTLGDNDYVNLFAINDKIRSAVPCFNNLLVRATPDNKKEIKAAANAIDPDGTANFTGALDTAFELLHQYNTSGKGSQCNQAIMVITDGPDETYESIIKQHNWPHRPVRIFTYLIGKSSSGAENLNWMACQNKGYFVTIKTPEDARKKVMQYAFVMARPMVLYQADHPVHWSPVFVGGRSSGFHVSSDEKRRLVITVTTPVFDRRNHSVRVANLLGVVGTDVPIEEIQKVIPQHKLGVNGYSFILDNNGKVLYHPDFRPMDDKGDYMTTLKPKYHSIDLTEVELPEGDQGQPGSKDRENENTNYLYDMRHEMVMQKEGETEIKVMVHHDDMKRVSMRNLRYYYGPIDGTPFSLALALPDKYGIHELKAQQEIRHSHTNVTEYFKGHNWKVNPDWVYCEYNTLKDLDKDPDLSNGPMDDNAFRDREPSTPEEQLLHFLAKAGLPGWKWMSLRPRSPTPHHNHNGNMMGHFAQHQNANVGSRKAEPYYCDRYLVQSLVRDAIVTEELEDKKEEKKNSHHGRKEMKETKKGHEMFSVTTTFVATRSGLLRWVDHTPQSPDSKEPHFSLKNARAIDQSWYKRAVDQHAIESEGFVYSVPFDSGYTGKNSSVLVTATHAIFIEHRGHKAPAAVVGLQFKHESLAKHFINITSTCTGSQGNCKKTCASDDLDCYLLDNNGFVLLSEKTEHTGKFFGQIDGTIMDSLVQDRIYRRVPFMDYQGICSDKDNPYRAAGEVIRPITPLVWFFKYFTAYIMTWLSFMSIPTRAYPHSYDDMNYEDYGMKNYDNYDENYSFNDNFPSSASLPPTSDRGSSSAPTQPAATPTNKPGNTEKSTGPRVIPDPAHARSCDLTTDLYLLQPERLNQGGQNNPLKGKLTNCHQSGCERPFSVQKIPNSNLILLVVDTLCPCGSKQLDIEPQEVPDGAGACGARRLSREKLERKRPSKCINYHPEEIEIQQCATATTILLASSRFLSLFSSLISFTIMLIFTSSA